MMYLKYRRKIKFMIIFSFLDNFWIIDTICLAYKVRTAENLIELKICPPLLLLLCYLFILYRCDLQPIFTLQNDFFHIIFCSHLETNS